MSNLTSPNQVAFQYSPGLSSGVILRQDNATPHRSNATTAKIVAFDWSVSLHPTNCPDVAPADYHLFPKLKQFLQDKWFANEEELKATVLKWFQPMGTIDVWRGIWRCTHAKLAPLTPHDLARDRHYGPASRQRGERFGAGNFSAPISPLLLKCADGVTTLSLRFGIDQDLLDGKLAAGCLRSGPPGSSSASVAGLLTAKTGDDEVWHWVLGGGSYGQPLPLPRYLHLAAHCQSDKSSHLVASFCAFQHNPDNRHDVLHGWNEQIASRYQKFINWNSDFVGK